MLLSTLKARANQYAIDVARVVELVPRVELRSFRTARLIWPGSLAIAGRSSP